MNRNYLIKINERYKIHNILFIKTILNLTYYIIIMECDGSNVIGTIQCILLGLKLVLFK
jgi:hypothetical protein